MFSKPHLNTRGRILESSGSRSFAKLSLILQPSACLRGIVDLVIINHYSPKRRWLAVDIRELKQRRRQVKNEVIFY